MNSPDRNEIICVDDEKIIIMATSAILRSSSEFNVIGVETKKFQDAGAVISSVLEAISERTHAVLLDQDMSQTLDGQDLFGHQIFEVMLQRAPEIARTRTATLTAREIDEIMPPYLEVVGELPPLYLQKAVKPDRWNEYLAILPLEAEPDRQEFARAFVSK